ncbi:MAG: discoidin domain-containing protein, partial [Kiritimatiellae bacterium]|nr:discoidin domain-containing protein [Kiritimatiellia bacterium]
EQPTEAANDPEAYFASVLAQETTSWSDLLNRFSIETGDPRLTDMMKTYLAYILLNKDDVWIKPGPRNYNHAWIRDGAMTSVALMRMGITEPVKRYVDAYSALVSEDGWAPFIILEGGHPVAFNEHGHEGQEYDSQGQYVSLVRQYYDFTGDEETVRTYYDKVIAALKFAARLREERKTEDYRNDPALKAYYGILPESNSHEGYFPAKHSYWDDYWYLRGLTDGAYLARMLGQEDDLAWIEAENADFRECLMNSLLAVIQRDNLSTIPGCVELGDFDSTSTAIALSACDEGDFLPEPYLSHTFNDYYRNTFKPRLTPGHADTFTPYEVRTSEAFIRMGRPQEALSMLNYFTDRSALPREWHHLAEVVHARNRAPSYLGDMPHTWIGAEYISAVRALFAYETNESLMLGAGIDPAWLPHGVRVSRLPTQYGLLSYSMALSEEGTTLEFKAEGDLQPPNGFALRLPPELEPAEVLINGQPAVLEDNLVRFSAFPVDITASINPEKVKKKAMSSTQNMPPKEEWVLTSSAVENNRFKASFAADGRMDTRWSSPASDPQWLCIDLGRETTVCGLILYWETAFSSEYRISVSTDGRRWTPVFYTDSNAGGQDDVNFRPVPARYLKIDCLKRASGWGHSLWEVDVKGMDQQILLEAPTAFGNSPYHMTDGDSNTVWISDGGATPEVIMDLRERRPFAGLRIDWGATWPQHMTLSASDDKVHWKELAAYEEGTGIFDLLMHQREEARYLKLAMASSSSPDQTVQIRKISLRAPDAVLTPMAAYELAAKKAPAGHYPEALNGRQAYWTIVGLPGDSEESLVDEYGNVEVRAGGPSLMPYVVQDETILSALDAEQVEQTLAQGHLPLPGVSWMLPQQISCSVDALADGQPGDAFTLVRYTLKNTSDAAVTGRLALVIRPLQINPKWQHGGLSLIRDLTIGVTNGVTEVRVNGDLSWVGLAPADETLTVAFNYGDVIRRLGDVAGAETAEQDEAGMLSGAMLFDYRLQPGESKSWLAVAPLQKKTDAMHALIQQAAAESPDVLFDQSRDRLVQFWEKKISPIGFDLGDRAVADTVKSQIAYILINQDGLAIQPGSRNYNRSWIRDGSITATALMRMGLLNEVKDYLNWYAASVQPDGLVPPILNNDGSVNEGFGSNLEYDSQGQFIYAVMQYYRVTQDRAFLESHFDALVAAMRFMQNLREKTLKDDYMAGVPDRDRFVGILPPSISHEGYSTPAHSYWDDFWALSGWQDGEEAAKILGRAEIAEWAAEQYQLLNDSVAASIKATMRTFKMDSVPASADYGDADVTSISIALAPCNQLDVLPEKELTELYDRYLSEIDARGEAGASYRYTPYEVRNIMALALLGRREDAWRLHDLLFKDRRPSGWNHFAEVVVSEPRLGTYIGDMPHTWVGAGYVNSVRGLLVREDGERLILLYATPIVWLEGEGVRLNDLPTAFGPLSMRAVYQNDQLIVDLEQAPDGATNIWLNWPRSSAPDQVLVDGKLVAETASAGMAIPAGAKTIQATWSTSEMIDKQTAQMLNWMKTNQDSASPEKQLLSDTLGGAIAQTFNNALAAMAYTALGEEERAGRILDFYRDATVKDNDDQFLQNLYYKGEARGFFQNAWLTEGDGHKRFHCAKDSDRWMGDMAWLVFACKQFDARFNTDRYEGLAQELFALLKSWYVPQGEGGYFAHGWRKSDTYLHEDHGHHEGNIDAYALCVMMGDLETAGKISVWLKPQLTRDDMPLDLYGWRALAFAPNEAECLKIPETVPGYKKTVIFNQKRVIGFTSFRNQDNNIWGDGLGHISCAYSAVNNPEKARFYLEQLGNMIIPESYNGTTEYGIPYTACNTRDYEWVNTREGFVSCAAWYIMAAQRMNPMQISK